MTNRFYSRSLMAGAAMSVLLLAGCGGEDEAAPARGTQSGSAVENAAQSALIDITAGSPIDKPFSIADADPADLDRFNALIESAEEVPFQIGEASFDEDLGAIVLTDVSNTEDGRVFTVARAELFEVNFDYLEALRDGEEVAGVQDVFRKVRLYDMSLTGFEDMDFDGTMTMGAMELDDLSLDATQMAEDVMSGEGFSLAGLFLKDFSVDAPADDVRALAMNVADLRLNDLARGSLGQVVFKGLDYTVSQDVDAAIAEMEMAGTPMDGLADSSFRTLFFPAEQTVSIASGKWDGMSLAGLLEYAATEEMPPVDAENLISVGKLEMSDMETSINGKPYAYTEYSMMEPIEFAWLIPARIRVTARDSVADMTAIVDESEIDLIELMEGHGLDDLRSEGEFLWTYDPESGAAAMGYDVDMPGFADIDMNYGVSGLNLATIDRAIANENPMALLGVAIDGLQIRIADQEMLDAVIDIIAYETDQEPAALRDSLTAQLTALAAQAQPMLPQADEYATALSGFIASGGTIEIAMSPDSPVPVMTVAMLTQTSPQMIAETLALTVTHEE